MLYFGVIMAYEGVRAQRLRDTCMDNVHQMGEGLQLYSLDWDNVLPKDDQWMDYSAGYINSGQFGTKNNPEAFHCPSAQLDFKTANRNIYGYSFNSWLNKLDTNLLTTPEATIMEYDSTNLSRDATDKVTSIAWKRHLGGANVGYVDGHAHWLAAKFGLPKSDRIDVTTPIGGN